MIKFWLFVFAMGLGSLAFCENVEPNDDSTVQSASPKEIAVSYQKAIVEAYNQAISQFPKGTKASVIKSSLDKALRLAKNEINQLGKAKSTAEKEAAKEARKAAREAKRDALRSKIMSGDTGDVDNGNDADAEAE